MNQQIKTTAEKEGKAVVDLPWSLTLAKFSLVRYQTSASPGPCLVPLSMFHIDVVEKFNEVDHGNNQLYIESKGTIMQTAIFFIVIAVAGLSLLLVFAFRYRRGSHNSAVLKDSNRKLDGLLWILASQFYPELLNDVSDDV